MGKRHRLGVLPEAVPRQNRVGVAAGELDQDAPQTVYRAHDRKELLALQRIDRNRTQVAGTARKMEPAANVLAEQPDQILLAGVKAATGLRAGLHDVLGFHLA